MIVSASQILELNHQNLTRRILARSVHRIGVETLYEEDGDYFVSIHNRTYDSTVKIDPKKVPVWKKELEGKRNVAK